MTSGCWAEFVMKRLRGFAVSLKLISFAAQVVLDSPFVSGASKQPIVVALR